MKLVPCKLREQVTKTGWKENSGEHTSHRQGDFHDLESLLRKSCFHKKHRNFASKFQAYISNKYKRQ